MLKVWKIAVTPFNAKFHSKLTYQISFNRFGSGLVAIFNNVSKSRIKLVGPDRACAEWLMRNGAFIKWVGESSYLSSYDELPLDDRDKRSYYLKEVNATGAAISHHGFPHFYGCKYVDKILLVKCRYVNNEALGMLSYLKNSLQDLEISECKKVTDKGLRLLNILGKLKTLKLSNLQKVNDMKGVVSELQKSLPNCQIIFQ